MGMSGLIISAARALLNIFFGITQMGDAAVTEQAYPSVNLGDRESFSGCLLRPTRHLEESRSFPYRTMGMSGPSSKQQK
jgi:hypothetical protein